MATLLRSILTPIATYKYWLLSLPDPKIAKSIRRAYRARTDCCNLQLNAVQRPKVAILSDTRAERAQRGALLYM